MPRLVPFSGRVVAPIVAVGYALLIVAGLLTNGVNAWSLPSSSSSPSPSSPLSSSKQKSPSSRVDIAADRRKVLQKVAATAGFLGVASSGGVITPKSANAAEAKELSLLRPKSTTTGTTTIPNTTSRPRNNTSKIYEPQPGSMKGKVVVITGGTSGLGLESSKRLAAAGATIVLTARTEAKGTKAIGAVKEYLADRSVAFENANLYALTLNLDDLDSVKSFPQKYSSLLGQRKIDVLMNNAGVAAIPEREVTKDGFERTFQTNHLGPYVLTSALFPYLNRGGCRIINVSSYAHQFAAIAGSGKLGLDINNLNGEVEYSGLGWPAYCRSKLENILFTQELQRRANDAGLDWLTVSALHPGRVGTDIWRTTYFGVDERGGRELDKGKGSIQSLVSELFYNSVLSVEEGANTQIMLAASGEQEGTPVKGQYFDQHMRLKEVGIFAKDTEKARYLWETSQELTGIDFKVQ